MPKLSKRVNNAKIQVMYLQYTYIEQFSDYTTQNTVREVSSKLKASVSELRTKDLRLTYSGMELKGDNNRICDLITASKPLITLIVTVKQIGGTQSQGFPKEIESDLKKKVCSVYRDTMWCVEMDCGCFFSWEGLRGEVKRQYTLHRSHKLSCFKCKGEWEVSDTIWICTFNKTDEQLFEKEFSRRKLGHDCTVCPQCGNIGKRDVNVKIHRLACGNCGLNYCLHCEKKWTGNGMILCGNTSCVNYDIQDQLNNCPLLKKKENETSNVYRWIEFCGENIPVLRACPKCICIIAFQDKCQHMTCPACKHEFCYICLADWKSNGNTHSYVSQDKQCRTAPRQKLY